MSERVFVVRCEVSGEVTGSRTAYAKDERGNTLYFPTWEAAQKLADRYTRHSPASFRYTVEEL